MKHPVRSFLLLLIAGLLGATSTHAATYAETGDAGDLPATAQTISGTTGTMLTDITGALTLTNNTSDGDMFRIYIPTPGTFSASMVFARGTNAFDSQLMLFSSTGAGIVANDDSAATGKPQAAIPAGALTGQPAGYYYLLVDGSGRYAVDAANKLIFPNYTDGTTDPTGTYGPNAGVGVVAGYTGSSSEAGTYDISLAGTQVVPVPEPAWIGAFGGGAAALALLRRLRRRHVGLTA